ncbi:metal-dependent hydrolase [Streptomyces sp. URMC 126]|uniref:metal-dependent hydrolase n=1 Tax=Streptomyces sp. URMC 126 TaxID=3423401 RepID=UPI003F19DBF7
MGLHETLCHRPRSPRFDWSDLPVHWVPGEPQVTHTLNVIHLLLPEGEHWFCRVFERALPFIGDERLRRRVLGFIGQERTHAHAHEEVQAHLRAQGLDIDPYLAQLGWYYRRVLEPREAPGEEPHREQIRELVAVAAAFEHLTAFIGQWLLDSAALDRAGAHPAMLDMLRWHGAEEVEHSGVAFDLLCHLSPGGGRARRVRAALIAGVLSPWLWYRGTRYLMAADRSLRGSVRCTLRAHRSAVRRGLLPSFPVLARASFAFLGRGYHPSKEYDIERALAYLARSPAARDADRL